MQEPARYRNIQVKVSDPVTGDLQVIDLDRKINENRAPLIEMPLIANSATVNYSATRTISIEVEGLRPAVGNKRTRVRVVHQDLPPKLRMRGDNYSGAFNPDEITDADGLDIITYPTTENVALWDHFSPRYLDHDTVENIIGRLRLQMDSPAEELSVYDWKTDRGNTGLTIMRFDVPIAEGNISARAAEEATETTNTGPTFVMIRPLFREGDGSLASQGFSYSRWHQVGCLESNVELEFLNSFAEVFKGYGQTRASKSMRQNLMDLNCSSIGDTEYLTSIIHNARIEKGDGITNITSQAGGLETFECMLETRLPSGLIKVYRLPRCVIIPNGNVTEGGDEKMIPFKIQSNEAPTHSFTENLYQQFDLSFGAVIPTP